MNQFFQPFNLSDETLTFRQRWATYFTILLAIFFLAIGFFFRDSILNSTTFYQDTLTGISAEYPKNWLIDRTGDYVFRVRDIQRTGFKTTFQIQTLSITSSTTERNIADRLALSRAQTFTDYRVISAEPFVINLSPDPNFTTQSLLYTFVSRDSNPFLESLPIVVIGLDVIQILGNQALIITFRADRESFDNQYPLFERFLISLDF